MGDNFYKDKVFTDNETGSFALLIKREGPPMGRPSGIGC
jgi:hypothetical protein